VTLSRGEDIRFCVRHGEESLGSTIDFACLETPLVVTPESFCNGVYWYSLNIPCNVLSGSYHYFIESSAGDVVKTGLITIT